MDPSNQRTRCHGERIDHITRATRFAWFLCTIYLVILCGFSLAQAMSAAYVATANQRNVKKTVIVANPSDLISPLVEVPSQEVQGTPFLGERVMNIKGSGAIPFGLQGTVVGIIDGLLEVVFDKEFIGGINLGHR